MTIQELYAKKSQFATRNVGTELVLVPLKNNVADMNALYTMNETGSFIWDHIDGTNTEEAIVLALKAEFEVEETEARRDLEGFLRSISEMML